MRASRCVRTDAASLTPFGPASSRIVFFLRVFRSFITQTSEPALITRIATAQDIPQLIEVINRAYVAEAPFVRGKRTDRLDLAERISTSNMWFVVFESDGEHKRIMGSVCIDCDGERGHIGLLSVDPDFQGQGLGAKLVRAAEEHCRTQMCCPVMELEVVSARTDLFGFYEHLGYARAGERPFPAEDLLIQPANLIVMRKTTSANS